MESPILKVSKLQKNVPTADGQLTILDNINFELAVAESVAIVGSSGAGKSTLLGLMAGLDVPSSGSVALAEYNFSELDEEQRAKVRAQFTGFVFQSFHLLSSLTALENVALPMELSGIKDASEKAKDYLNKVGLAQRATHYPKHLSGGEQQRVAIARAFACQPKILFADEPTGNLDAKTGAKVADLLFDLNDSNQTTLVLVTHEQRLADRCKRTITLEEGKVVQDTAAK